MELTHEQKNAFSRAAVLCSRFEKCTSDIQEKLKLWGLNEADSKAVIRQLKDEKYLDDERFTRAFVKDKFRFNHWGRQKIAYMLRAKNISHEIQELAFEEIEEESYSDNLRKLLADKARSVKAKDVYDKRSKLMRFAMGRGFEPDVIYKVLKELGI